MLVALRDCRVTDIRTLSGVHEDRTRTPVGAAVPTRYDSRSGAGYRPLTANDKPDDAMDRARGSGRDAACSRRQAPTVFERHAAGQAYRHRRGPRTPYTRRGVCRRGGAGWFVNGAHRHRSRHDVLFVKAGVVHRFEDFSDDCLGLFLRPEGGEADPDGWAMIWGVGRAPLDAAGAADLLRHLGMPILDGAGARQSDLQRLFDLVDAPPLCSRRRLAKRPPSALWLAIMSWFLLGHAPRKLDLHRPRTRNRQLLRVQIIDAQRGRAGRGYLQPVRLETFGADLHGARGSDRLEVSKGHGYACAAPSAAEETRPPGPRRAIGDGQRAAAHLRAHAGKLLRRRLDPRRLRCA